MTSHLSTTVLLLQHLRHLLYSTLHGVRLGTTNLIQENVNGDGARIQLTNVQRDSGIIVRDDLSWSDHYNYILG